MKQINRIKLNLNHKSEKGLSLIGLIVSILLIGGIGILGFQVGMGYIDQQSIRGIVKSTLSEEKSNPSTTSKIIKDKIERKLSTGYVTVNDDDITVDSSDSGFDVEVDHTKEIQLSKTIKIVMDLTVKESTSGK